MMGFSSFPLENGAACDFVLGQREFASVDRNQATYLPTAAAMNMPYGLAVIGEQAAVADTANSRLLGFDIDRLSMNAAATHLTGQPGFGDKGDNRWGVARRDSVCWPYSISAGVGGSTSVVSDSGNNRVLLWERA